MKTEHIIIGGLVMAGLGVGAYFLFRPKEEPIAPFTPAPAAPPPPPPPAPRRISKSEKYMQYAKTAAAFAPALVDIGKALFSKSSTTASADDKLKSSFSLSGRSAFAGQNLFGVFEGVNTPF